MTRRSWRERNSFYLKCFFNTAIILMIWLVVGHFIDYVSFDDFKGLLNALTSTAAMTFTIVGIWLAYIYPNAMTALVNPDEVELVTGRENANRISMLVGIIITSALVIVGIVFFYLCKALIYESPFYFDNVSFIRRLGYTAILSFSYFQVICVFKVIVSNLIFINDLYKRLARKELDDQF